MPAYYSNNNTCTTTGTASSYYDSMIYGNGGTGGCTTATASGIIDYWDNGTSTTFTNFIPTRGIVWIDDARWTPRNLGQEWTPPRNVVRPETPPATVVRAGDTEREKAGKVAREFLLEYLTPEQRETFVKNKWFIVEGGKSKKKYRINEGLTANIDVMEEDKITHRLCAHADRSKYPLGDHLLAQKLMLEADEASFLKIANRHEYHRAA